MIIIKTKLILPIALLTLAGGVIYGSVRVYAQTPTKPYQSIIQKLVEKFGLKETDVQAVFDEARAEHQTQMQTRLEDRLTQAVKDGKLTESQKEAIIAKQKELQNLRQTNMENWKNLSPEQRKTEKQNQKNELEAWDNQNGIDLKYLFGGFGIKRGHWKGF